MRALIVDDEAIARRELRRLLEEHPQVEVLGEAEDVEDAKNKLERLDPDLLLLDIEMPGATGFSLLEQIDPVPHVVFTTAYDEFALRAFEVNALDYLMKPIEPERLARALEKVERELREEAPRASGQRLGLDQRVFVRDGDRCWFLALREVVMFESAGNYTRVIFAGGRPLIRRSLTYLEERVDPTHFFRANRSQMVGLSHVAKIEPWFGDRLRITLRDGRRVELSRRSSLRFRELGL